MTELFPTIDPATCRRYIMAARARRAGSKERIKRQMIPPKHETIVYRIVDREAWINSPNPFNWPLTHGLKLTTLSHGDACEALNEIREIIVKLDLCDDEKLTAIAEILDNRHET